MVKKLILVLVATLFFVLQVNIGSASALKIDKALRTITLNGQGDQITLSNEEVKQGAKLFNSICTQCHLQGKTKTNPNIGLGLSELAGAEPPRDNVLALVDYLKHPFSYDGEDDLSLIHPNTDRADLFPEMRNLSDDDLTAIAGHMLIQPNLDEKWGGTIYF